MIFKAAKTNEDDKVDKDDDEHANPKGRGEQHKRSESCCLESFEALSPTYTPEDGRVAGMASLDLEKADEPLRLILDTKTKKTLHINFNS